jgi:hypothetical protein
MAKYIQGKFSPKNPKKYKGDVTNIVFRSSWELTFLNRCDTDPNILEYSSEEFCIPYRSPIDNKIHRYYPDMKIKVKTPSGSIETYVIEIKPKKQTQEPIKRTKKTKQYVNEVVTYLTNQAKWCAADIYCQQNKYEFKILTEDDLGIKY